MSFDLSDSENESVEEQLKVVLLGEPSVGKTSIVTRYCNNEFTKQYFPTCGVDFFLKRLVLQRDRNVTLKIWDVGGTAHNGNMIDKYIFGANIIFLVYDVTNDTSFSCIPHWMELVKDVVKMQETQPMMVLVGNKCDLEHQRSIRQERHEKFSNDSHISSHVVSSRTGESVSLAFQKTAAEYLGIKLTRSEIEEQQPVVRAEISTHSNIPLQPVRNSLQHSRSSICTLQ
ncbi:UNVERIFIED_CONTAM: hypothetical protein PYX00_009437 [Menopon gallinae]|uniref:Ras-related protein Rab-28 n=1 Tax=Menopon gallinae TaxID=328185 RepID=A0AAW2HBN1_9NEOP